MTPAEALAAAKKSGSIEKQKAHRTFRTNLKELREAYGLTVEEVAGAIGSVPQTLVVLEKGRGYKLSTALALCKFYGCRIEDLWPEFAPDFVPAGK